MAYTGIIVVVPTRNRSAIAMNAVRSVLDQPVENLSVLVSDNSTSESEREALAQFCSAQNDARLRYVRYRGFALPTQDELFVGFRSCAY